MLELTKEQIQQLVDTIESKQDCHCSVSNSMRTIWITSSDGENELRVAFLGNFALVLSRVEFAHKRCGTMTAILFALKKICEENGVHRIIIQSTTIYLWLISLTASKELSILLLKLLECR